MGYQLKVDCVSDYETLDPVSDKKQPHYKNNFFQTAFSRKETAMGLAGLINPEVSAAIDWDSLKQESTSFVDPSLAAKEADILYSVKQNGEDAYVYILLEHQSTQPKWMMLRMAGYIVRIHEHHLKTHPEVEKLPVVLPIVLYQGTENWTRSTQYIDYFDVNEKNQAQFSRYIPDFECEIISLSELPISRIVGDPYFTISMRMMKALRDGSLLVCIDETRERLEFTWVERQDHDFVLACFFYALHGDIDKTEVLDKFKTIQNQELKQTVMTAAEQLIEEGRHEGLEKGLQKGRQQDIIEVLEIRFSTVPDGLKEAIQGIMDDAKLGELLRACVKCASIEDFTKNL